MTLHSSHLLEPRCDSPQGGMVSLRHTGRCFTTHLMIDTGSWDSDPLWLINTASLRYQMIIRSDHHQESTLWTRKGRVIKAQKNCWNHLNIIMFSSATFYTALLTNLESLWISSDVLHVFHTTHPGFSLRRLRLHVTSADFSGSAHFFSSGWRHIFLFL